MPHSTRILQSKRRVLVLAAAGAALWAAPARSQAAPTPDPIAKITIQGNVAVATDEIMAVLSQKTGDAYSPDKAQKDRDAIRAMGDFNSDVGLSVTADTRGGEDLTYTVKENPVVKEIIFTANTPDKRPDVPAADLKARMATKEGQLLNANRLTHDMDVLFNHRTGYVRSLGYLIDASPDVNIDPNTGILTIPLVEAHVASVTVTGNQKTPAAQIGSALGIKPNDVLNDKKLNAGLTRIYNMGGFTSVGPAAETPVDQGEIAITIPVVEATPAPAQPSAAVGTLTTLYSFGGPDGAQPGVGLNQGRDGAFYGTTERGGANDNGTVFKITPGGTLTTLYSFTGGEDGSGPEYQLILGRDGEFYGVTNGDSATHQGTVFKITPSGKLTTLSTLPGADTGGAVTFERGKDGNYHQADRVGSKGVFVTLRGDALDQRRFAYGQTEFIPGAGVLVGGLEPDKDGSRYEADAHGGASGKGSLIKIAADGTRTMLYSFTGPDGSAPRDGLFRATDGSYYGTTLNGGAHGQGTIFKWTPPAGK